MANTKESIGAKAYNLIKLKNDFLIPEFFVITAQNFSASTLEKHLQSFDDDTLFAVRSSSSQEDSAEHSFAGLFETLLNVAKSDIYKAVEEVLNSHKSERIQAYCKTHKLELPIAPAIIVQRMLAPSCAGVSFSSDPISGDREVSIVSAVHGLGDSLVDGEESGDTFYVKNHTLFHKKILQEDATLSDVQAIEVADLAKSCETFFAHPQDIEWAYENGTLYLLQSRPITTIPSIFEGEKRLWDNSNIVESYSGVTTPLTYSFARYIYEEVYIEFCKVLQVPKVRVTQNRHSFKTLLGLLHGNIYYNMMSWYRILALLPGFKYNREFMEQMMGVKEGLPSSIVKELEESSSGSKFTDLLGLIKTFVALIYQQSKINTTIKNFYKRLEGALIPNKALKTKNIDELVAHYRNLEAQLLNRWDAPLINDFLAMIYFGTLGKLCKKWINADEYLQNDLLIDSGEIISAEPALRIIKMADKIRALGQDAIDVLAHEDAHTIETWLKRQGKLDEDIQAYLEKFGDRTLEELKLESLTLEDDATSLYRAIANMASRPYIEKRESDAKHLAQKRVTSVLQKSKIKLKIMNFVIKNARERVTSRENLRFERTKLFGHIRRIFLEIAKHLQSRDIIDDERDIFYLEVNEIFGYIEGSATTLNLKELIALRKSEFQSFKDKELSSRFYSYGVVNYNNTFRSAHINTNDSSSELSGFGCCAGKVTAKVRVIEKPEGAQILEGEILVARQTDPGWIMLFPSAAGILVERGSMLSHSAIVAREMNIPAIVGIEGLMQSLKTGDVVSMNGATGSLELVTQNV